MLQKMLHEFHVKAMLQAEYIIYNIYYVIYNI